MHELSIALSLLSFVEEEAARREARVVAIHLRLGPLSGLVGEALSASFALAREGTELQRTELIIEPAPIVVMCPTCGAERTVPCPQDLRCPQCGTAASTVVHGRELEVFALELAS